MTGAKPKKKGRPSLYTEALAAKICRRLADGEPLRAICRDKEMPDKAMRRRDYIDLDVGERGLVLEAKRRAFGFMPNESVNVPDFTYVEIDWGCQ